MGVVVVPRAGAPPPAPGSPQAPGRRREDLDHPGGELAVVEGVEEHLEGVRVGALRVAGPVE
eukprot:15302483-Alexandrium_andersonii.AAC.1